MMCFGAGEIADLIPRKCEVLFLVPRFNFEKI